MTLARIKNDVERQYWHYLSRTNLENPHRVKLIQAPQTTRIQGGTGAVQLSPSFQTLVQTINTPEAFKYVKRNASGWVNRGPWPKIEQLTFGSNLVDVIKLVHGKAYIRHLDAKKPAPEVTFETDPCVVHKFTVVTPDGTVVEPPRGVTYILVVGSTDMWIPAEDLEFLETPNEESPERRKIMVSEGPVFQMPNKTKVAYFTSPMLAAMWDEAGGWIKISDEPRWVPRDRVTFL